MPYLLDANIFIQAKNLHYGFDFCPAFWEWIRNENKKKNLYSIQKVQDELKAGNDTLSKWAVKQDDRFFLPPDNPVLKSLADVSVWVSSQNFDPGAINTFLQIADYYLISHAHAHKFTLVTHEVPSNSLKKIQIPNVCIGLKIKFMNPFEMLRNEKAKFILGSDS